MTPTPSYSGIVRLRLVLIGLLVSTGCSLSQDYDECRIPGRCLREDTQTLCQDEQDNDDDGLIDCRDPSCSAFCEETGAELCGDDVDNDGDNLFDCNDPSCSLSPPCLENDDIKCSDGKDTNLDGLTDCDDPGCCSTRVCHNVELCAQDLFFDDFSTPLGENWDTFAHSSGYLVPENTVERDATGLHLYGRTGCYTYSEEVGLVTKQAFDLTQGRLTFEVDYASQIHVRPGFYPLDLYWSLALVSHNIPNRFILRGGARIPDIGGIRECEFDEPFSEVLPEKVHPEILNVYYYKDGRRMVMHRRLDDDTFFPVQDHPIAVGSQKTLWETRMDIDDEEIVLFERLDGKWSEVYRFSNPYVGRRFHLALYTSMDQLASDLEVWIPRVRVRQATGSSWQTVYEDTFDQDPHWEASDPTRCHYDEEEGAMAATWIPASEEVCVTPLSAAIEGGTFRLDYEFNASRVDEGNAFVPSLLDDTLSYSHGFNLGAGLGHPTNSEEELRVDSCARSISYPAEGTPLTNRWWKVTFIHDGPRDLLTMDVHDAETGEPLLYELWESPGCLMGHTHFGFTSVDRNVVLGERAEGFLRYVSIRQKGAP